MAEIYGYETKNFKRQVKNNIAKFEGDDFMFELNDEEVEELSRCKNSNNRIFPCVVLFFVIGFCSESIDVKEEMRFESILRMLIRLGLAAVFVQVIAGAAAYKAIH